MTLSSEALSVVEEHFKELSISEAAASGDLSAYEPDAIGGFIPNFKLSNIQKKALAWMDMNGNRGVCGLDTGIGKTLVGIAMMQKMVRDGLADPDAGYLGPDGVEVKTNGLFLLVVPDQLKGGHPKEIRSFLTEPFRSVLEDKLDILGYTEFSKASSSKKVPASLRKKPFWKDRQEDWDPTLYVSVLFDEAHLLKKTEAPASKAAQDLWHPRKICFTASPMEKEPMEAYNLAAICNNLPLRGNDPEARDNKAERLKFKARYCEVVNGRIIGAKQDPLLRRELNTWVRRNIFYGDKRDDRDDKGNLKLGGLTQHSLVVPMAPEVEMLYRGVTSSISEVLISAVALFDRHEINKNTKNKAVEGLTKDLRLSKLGPFIQIMNGLSDRPAETLLEIARMMEEKTVIRKKNPEPLPEGLAQAFEAWSQVLTPNRLREIAATLGNPKLQAAQDFITGRQDRNNSRTLLFSDDPAFCKMTAKHMAQEVGGLYHLLALDKSIHVFDAGGAELSGIEIPDVGKFSLPFVRQEYRRQGSETAYKEAEWQQFVFGEIVNPNQGFRTATLLGSTYSHGFNLQAFDTVIHLDRDTWNAEAMKQRTARSWRQGQKQPVDEVTIDSVYPQTDSGLRRSETDVTLDEIRKYVQILDGAVFDQIIRDAHNTQKNPDKLGQEWLDVAHQDAANLRVNRKFFELAMSPVLGRTP